MNTFLVETQGYIASISFSNDDITNIYKCSVLILIYSNSKTYFRLAFIVNHILLYLKMFILASRFRKWLLRFFSNVLKVTVKGQRSTQLKWTVYAYTGDFSYNDDAVRLK